MARISLVEQYDNKDVIQQIYKLKTATDGWEERISASEQASNEALTKADGFDERIQEVADAQADVDNKIEGFDTRIATANQTADNAVAKVDTLDRQVDTRIADQEVKGLSVASAGTGAYAVTAVKQNGNVTSNSFNVSKVTSATIGEGEAQNSIYLQLNLSDGTTVRTNDTVISITGVEEDIHVTSIVLEDAPDAHTIKAIFTYNNGQSISSNTLTYDYPDIASSSSPGLVMGNDATGGVQVDGQGRMTVVGWDTFATQDALEALEDEVGAVGQAGTIRNDLDILNKLTAFYGNRAVLNDVGTTGYQTDTDNPNLVKYGFQYTKAYKDGTAVKNEIVDDYFIPIYSNKLVGGGDKATLYSTKYIDGLETTLQQNIDAMNDAIANKQDKLVPGENMDTTITYDSQAPATSRSIYNAIAINGGAKLILPSKTIGKSAWLEEILYGEASGNYYVRYETTDTWFVPSDGTAAHDLALLVITEGDPTMQVFDVLYERQSGASVGYITIRTSQKVDVTITVFADATPGVDTGGTHFIRLDGSSRAVTIDKTLSTTSDNAVANYVVTEALNGKASTQELADKQDKLTAGTGITIEDNVISAIGGSTEIPDNVLTTDWLLDDRNVGPYLIGGVYNASGFRSSESTTGAYRAINGFNLRREVDGVVTTTAINVETGPAIYSNKMESTAASGHVYSVPYINGLETTLQTNINTKQDKLTAGTGISIVDGVISVNLSNANGVSF